MADPTDTGPKATPRLPTGAGRTDQQFFPPISSRERCTGVVVGRTSPSILPDIANHRTSPLTSNSSSRSSFHHPTTAAAPPSSPTKLPTISKKSSSISNLASLGNNVRRTSSLPAEGLRAELCRSPSCPTLWACDLNDDLGDFRMEALQNGGDTFPPSRSRDHNTSDSPTKLPSIFGGSTVMSNKSVGSMRRSSSLQSRLSTSLVDAPSIATHRSPRLPKRDTSVKTSVSMPLDAGGAFRDRSDVSPVRRAVINNPMLLPMRSNDGKQKLKRSGSKKGGTTPGTLHPSEGTSGDSGVSVGCRPSDRSDSSAAQDGSEQGGIVWGADVEVEMDDETVESRLQETYPTTTPTARPSSKSPAKSQKSEDRTALSAEKCREWLENVSEDGRSKTNTRDKKKAFKMPKIN